MASNPAGKYPASNGGAPWHSPPVGTGGADGLDVVLDTDVDVDVDVANVGVTGLGLIEERVVVDTAVSL